MTVGDGYSQKASRELLSELLPDTQENGRTEKEGPRWPWLRPSMSDSDIAAKISEHVSKGADPSFCLRAPQGCFMPLGVAAWLGLEKTVQALLDVGAQENWPLQDEIQAEYKGIPLDPLAAAAQALGVAASLQYEEEELQGIVQICERIGSIASPFRADPGTGRNPIEEIFTQIDENSASPRGIRAVGNLLWTWVSAHLSASQMEVLALSQTDTLSIPGVSDQVPSCLAPRLQALALQWHIGRSIDLNDAPKAQPRGPRSQARF